MIGLLGMTGAAAALSLISPRSPTASVLTGGSPDGRWDAGLSVGYPWTRLRVQRGLPGGWTPFVETDTALLTRWRPAVGVSLPWVDRHWRISGEATAGWLVQTGTLAESGPSASLGLRMGRAHGRVLPYLHAGSEHTVIVDRVVTSLAGGAERIDDTARHAWTLTGALGVGLALGRSWGLDLGLDLPWVDVPKVSIPGVHLGLQLGAF